MLWRSKAPESHAAPCGRSTPRWSVAGGGQSPSPTRSTAGLSGWRAMVLVGPPLSERRAGSRRGLVAGRELLARSKPQEVPLSMLKPPSTNPKPPQFLPLALLAIIVLRSVAPSGETLVMVALRRLLALFWEKVLFTTVSGPSSLKMAPPWLALLRYKVVFVTVSVPLWLKM